ncbi:MAG: GTPase HflX, partial [Schleiferiaceae bacterium]
EGRPAGTLDELKSAWVRRTQGQCAFISALHKDQFDALREMIYRNAATIHAARFPFDTYLY